MKALIQEAISAQCACRPEATALVMQGERMSYAELEQRSNQLARALKAAGCTKGERIASAIPKSLSAIIALIAVMKADCIHVPLDTASPAARLSKILKSSEPRLILGTGSTEKLLNELLSSREFADLRLGWLDAVEPQGRFKVDFRSEDIRNCSSAPLAYENRSSDIVHILYTSGSTGDPKGVAITHANVLAFIAWATSYFGTDYSDRISCHPPLHFDLATFDIVGTLSVGAELHLVPPTINLLPNKLADFMRSSRLTQWFSVPSVLTYMAKFEVIANNDFPTLRRLLWCGEVLPTPVLRYWMQKLPHVQFTNLYGPTEATIASSYYTVPAVPCSDSDPIPIGTACEGEELLVLDQDLRPVPADTVGDLYIGGVGLSPGYWRDAAKSKAVFLPVGESDRVYKTGDLAKLGTDGLVYFLGRADSQIKSRGYRIELGEIESCLNALPQVKACAVVAVPSPDFEGSTICCAFVPDQGPADPVSVRSSVAKSLPNYMLPAHWLVLDQLPINANGKIDRPKLREIFLQQLIDKGTQSRSDLHSFASASTTIAPPSRPSA